MLGELRGVWAPDALAVSFKLETDEALLLAKVSTPLPPPGLLDRPLPRTYSRSSSWPVGQGSGYRVQHCVPTNHCRVGGGGRTCRHFARHDERLPA